MDQGEGKEAYERGLLQGSTDHYVGFELQKYLLHLLLHPLRTWRHFLSREAGRLFLFYAGLNFVLGFAGASGFFASNALLLGAGGPQAIRPAYAVSATGSIVLAGLIYLIASKVDYRRLLRNSLFFLAFISLVFGLGLGPHPENLALTFSLRIFMFIAIFWIHLLFWNAVGSLFSNLESKRYFPLFIVAEILGEVIGSLGLEFGSRVLSTYSYCFVFAGLAVFAAGSFWLHPRYEKNIVKHSAEIDSPKESSFWNRGAWILVATTFCFWCAYSFISSGMDLIFNQIALENFGSGNSLTAYLGAIAFFGNSAVLLYQTLFSESLSLRFGVTRSLTAICWAGSACLALFLIHPNLKTAELSQQTLFFFVDFAAIALFSSMMSLVPASQRSRWLALTEGIGRPLGCFLLLALPVGENLTATLAVYRTPLFAGLLFMAAIPIPFAWIYRRHLREHLSSSDQDLKKNVVEALGESANWEAVAPLCETHRQESSLEIKDSIVLAIGRIVGHEDWEQLPPGLPQFLLGLEQGFEEIFPKVAESLRAPWLWARNLWSEESIEKESRSTQDPKKIMFEALVRPIVVANATSEKPSALAKTSEKSR